jgi:hypothetical protein
MKLFNVWVFEFRILVTSRNTGETARRRFRRNFAHAFVGRAHPRNSAWFVRASFHLQGRDRPLYPSWPFRVSVYRQRNRERHKIWKMIETEDIPSVRTYRDPRETDLHLETRCNFYFSHFFISFVRFSFRFFICKRLRKKAGFDKSRLMSASK